MRIRIRHPGGQAIINVPDTATANDLRDEIRKVSNIAEFDLKRGYPPEHFDIDILGDSITLSEAGLDLNGEQLIVARREPAHESDQQAQNKAATSSVVPGLPQPSSDQPPPQTSSGGTHHPRTISRDIATDSPEISIPDRGATLVLRVMPDDNSCLFRALSYVMLGPGIDSMHELRSLVASVIDSNPEKYSDAILGKSREQYCRWIQTDASWGGYVELSILAQHFGIEVASINVQDGRVDRYGEGAGMRCILVYSGIHYDAVALSPHDRLGFGLKSEPEDDIKVFESGDDIVLAAALDLCTALRDKHYFTDTSNFTVKCNICGWKGSGEQGAMEHAKATRHMNFGEG